MCEAVPLYRERIDKGIVMDITTLHQRKSRSKFPKKNDHVGEEEKEASLLFTWHTPKPRLLGPHVQCLLSKGKRIKVTDLFLLLCNASFFFSFMYVRGTSS